jgi:hypothetical protein
MSMLRCERLARLATGALLVLSVQTAVVLRPARAGCSHLVTARADHSRAIKQLDLLIVGGAVTRSSVDLDPESLPAPAGHKPCAGASCSSRTPLPASSASSGTAGFDQWCAVSVPAYLITLDPSTGTFDERTSRALGQATSIFHPPRV